MYGNLAVSQQSFPLLRHQHHHPKTLSNTANHHPHPHINQIRGEKKQFPGGYTQPRLISSTPTPHEPRMFAASDNVDCRTKHEHEYRYIKSLQKMPEIAKRREGGRERENGARGGEKRVMGIRKKQSTALGAVVGTCADVPPAVCGVGGDGGRTQGQL